MSRSRQPKCPLGRAKCGVCTDSKQLGRRLRERATARVDARQGDAPDARGYSKRDEYRHKPETCR